MDRHNQNNSGNHHGGQAVPEHDLEGRIVDAPHPLEDSFRCRINAPVLLRRGWAQKTAAHHGRQAQGDETRNEDRNPDRDRELMEQPAKDSAHEEYRDKDRGEGKGHGQDGEAYLPGAMERRLDSAFAQLHVPDDVFQHHDGIVHNKADGERQRHQREIVHAVTEEIHCREGAHDGHGQRHARDHGRRQVPEEQENHQYDEADGQ